MRGSKSEFSDWIPASAGMTDGDLFEKLKITKLKIYKKTWSIR
jgi:hypothetical protein